MFFAKVANKYYFKRKLGTMIDGVEKCICGCCCVGTILVFLIGPFLMFSNLSMFSEYNMVTDAVVTFDMKLTDLSTNQVFQS